MPNSDRFLPLVMLRSGIILSLVLLATPTTILAHGGHGDEFQRGTEATQSPDAIQVDAETAKRLGIKVESVKRQSLEISIKTTGQIETLPSKKVEVTAPIAGTVVELLVEPGDGVKVGQSVAVLSAPDLVELRVNAQEKKVEADADLQEAQADLKLAQEDLERQRQIALAEIQQARIEVEVAQEQYNRDRDLVSAGALPRRQMLESQAHLAEAQAQLTKASSKRDVLEAEAQLKRAQTAVKLAQSRRQLSNSNYQTRLQQLGTKADAKGLVTVTAPISGKVADREVTLGQSFEDAGGKLMTIINDSRILATANIYEKDIDKIEIGQQVNLKITSLPDRRFTGKIKRIGSVVEGETRVVPVQAELDNSEGVLKPGMFVELEVLTDQTPVAILAIPNSAIVEANGKNLVYIQNGNSFQGVEVILGQRSGDWVEIKSGLFEGDWIVTQRSLQLYAQSLRGDSKPKEDEENHESLPQATGVETISFPLPLWMVGVVGGGAISVVATVAFWVGHRTRPRWLAVGNSEYNGMVYKTETYLDNHQKSSLVKREQGTGNGEQGKSP